MGRKKQYHVVIYEEPYFWLKEYCSENDKIMSGVVSRLVREFMEREYERNLTEEDKEYLNMLKQVREREMILKEKLRNEEN